MPPDPLPEPTPTQYPRCKRCGATAVRTAEWFGPGEFNARHLCDFCFKGESEKPDA